VILIYIFIRGWGERGGRRERRYNENANAEEEVEECLFTIDENRLPSTTEFFLF